MRIRPARFTTIVARAALVCAAAAVAGCTAPIAPTDPAPQTLEEFQASARRAIDDAGVPGAGIALVRRDGVEWEGGLGVANRARGTPVTARTIFGAGAISKTLVALSLVQLYEDGLVDLDTPVKDIVPELVIDNPWEDTAPIRVLHLLQHTAGFDDAHANERYVPAEAPAPSLEDALRLNPASRRVRWEPGVRVADSDPGYAVAAMIVERAAEEPFDEYIAQEIFAPLGMTASGFRHEEVADGLSAQGHTSSGDATRVARVHFRPARGLHTSAHDLGRLVRMFLNWGELDTAFVVDPEYLGSMEQPRDTLAASAGLRTGYGTGLVSRVDLPFPVIGNDGSVHGFTATFGYSPSRDVGFVILLNREGAGDAATRLASLAIRYLKRDVEPPLLSPADVDAQALDEYVGYYHDANPQHQLAWALQGLAAGHTVSREGPQLFLQPFLGARQILVPVGGSTFRREREVGPSLVFARAADGGLVLAGGQVYAEQRPRWRVDAVRYPVLLAGGLVASVGGAAAVWLARIGRAAPHAFWALKLALLLCPLVLLSPVAALAVTSDTGWGVRNAATTTVWLATLATPLLALTVCGLTISAMRHGAGRGLTTYAGTVALAMGVISLYMSAHGVLGLRLWEY